VFRAVLIDRGQAAAVRTNPIEPLLSALANGRNSLILFPEGSRGRGADMRPFKSGLYYLAKQRPDIELVPTLIGHFGRMLPAGWPVPGSLSFGTPLRLEPGEEKFHFLARARAAVAGLRTL
jgi:1-acyl-sn-glycerol-3-phosphate acyltransferase